MIFISKNRTLNMKKIIRLTENELHKNVEQTTSQVINVMNRTMPYQVNKQSGMITEMARINTDESDLFPYNSFVVQIWSNDHTPPHFHILKDGWDIEFLIEDGKLYKVKKNGKNQQTYNYIIQNVNQWLSSKCAVLPIITNQQNAFAIWKQLHG
jgi:hypothetical protein